MASLPLVSSSLALHADACFKKCLKLCVCVCVFGPHVFSPEHPVLARGNSLEHFSPGGVSHLSQR